MSIYCIGQSVYDITAAVSEDIKPDTKYRFEQYNTCAGGPALNSACLCSLWGVETQLVSRIAHDTYGQMVLASLSDYDVMTDSLIEDSDAETSFSFIVVNNKTGERIIFNHPSPYRVVPTKLPNIAPTVILSDGHEPDATLDLIHAFPEAISIVDAGTMRNSTMRVAQESEYLICSSAFAQQYLGHAIDITSKELSSDLSKIAQINEGCQVVVTLGSAGLVYLTGNTAVHMPAFNVKVIDSTGAGDIFHGAFAFGMNAGLSLRDSLILSSMTSAISVTRLGSQTSIPLLKEVLDALDSRGIALPLLPNYKSFEA